MKQSIHYAEPRRPGASAGEIRHRYLRAAVLILIVISLFPPAAGAAVASVSIGSTLSPRDLTVAVGTDVTWRNDDGDRHRMRTTSGPTEFDSGNLDAGESFTFTFDQDGTYLYVDDRNRSDSNYYGTIIVTSGPIGDPGEPPPPPPPAGDVTIANDTFQPASITVNVGGTVTWSNQDREHTVTARDRSWDSGIFDSGQTYTRTFDTAGTYEYFCIIHPDMVATVVATAGTGEPPPPPPPPPPPLPPPPPPLPPPPAGASDVSIIDNDFDPITKTISVGSTVRWVNTGQLPHTVTINGQFDSGFLMNGDTWSRTFNSAGTFNYICTLHPEMQATIVVTGTSGEAPPPPADDPPPVDDPPPDDDPPPPPAPVGAISIIDNDYQPGTRTAAVGSTVRWVNTGQLPHTVTVNGQFDSGFLMNGDTWSRTFNSAGTFNYICTIHPEMIGTIIVTGSDGGEAGDTVDETASDAPSNGLVLDNTSTASAPVGPIGYAVAMVDNAYDPVGIEIRAGDSITWNNAGELPHTVTARNESFDSGFLMNGDVWTIQFDEAGEFEYFCTIHPEMVGTVTVVAATTSDVDASGASSTSAAASSDGTSQSVATQSPAAAGVSGGTGGTGGTGASIAVMLLLVLLTVLFILFLVHEVDFAPGPEADKGE